MLLGKVNGKRRRGLQKMMVSKSSRPKIPMSDAGDANLDDRFGRQADRARPQND